MTGFLGLYGSKLSSLVFQGSGRSPFGILPHEIAALNTGK